MRILIDNNLPPSLAAALEAEGIDAVHVLTLGLSEASDHRTMQEAVERGDVVLTRDNDFPQILAITGASGPSTILLRQGEPSRIPDVVRLVVGIPEPYVEGLDEGAVVSVDEESYRMRRLPIR